MNFRLNRPKTYPGKGDKFLKKIIQDLAGLIRKTQKELKYNTIRLPGGKIRELAEVLVEFAEDVHNDIGIWKSLEQYNYDFFGTKLPLILKTDEDIGPNSINKYRIQYLLLVQYELINPQLIISPTHQDLCFLAEIISDFLEDRFKNIPKDSSVKTFLDQPNDYGWDIKRKLIWVGKNSYLFRQCYKDYIERNGGKQETAIIDDFICQETTLWSGLGVIDILASLLNITKRQKNDIRSWYERHAAFYKVLSAKDPLVEMLNIINDKSYTIRVGEFSSQFDVNHVYYQSLTPWNDEWYLSGVQYRYGKASEKDISELKESFLSKSQTIAYRYCDELLNKSIKSLRDQYNHFVEYHGKDLAVYPDGNSMAADFNKQNSLYNESKLKSTGSNSIKNQNHNLSDLTKSFPPELLDSDNGVGLYFNPNEGHEIIREYYDIINGFKKKGVNLDEDEMYVIRGFISSTIISPHFVKKLVEEYSDESISATFLIPDSYKEYYLEYLLRKYKGDFYRNRYPSISFVKT